MGAWVVWLLLGATLPRVALIAPHVTTYKDRIRIECRIARHPENRWLRIGLADITDSVRQIDGERDRVVHELIVRPPCETVTAYCLLIDANGKEYLARQTVLVVPCSLEESL